MTLRRRLAALVAAVALVAPASAYADTAAVAVNTKDGFDVFRLAFAVRRAASDVVDTGNAAVAFASCTDCQTIALAIQVVLVTGDPSVVTPENLALAVNVECSLCDTLASAYQFVLSTGGAVRFTAEGQRRLVDIRKALMALAGSGLSAVEIQQRVDALMDELRNVLETELVPAGQGNVTGPPDDPGTPSPAATSPAPTSSGTATTEPSRSPDATATTSPSPSASPSASPSSPEATP